jgi:hypothetical protein
MIASFKGGINVDKEVKASNYIPEPELTVNKTYVIKWILEQSKYDEVIYQIVRTFERIYSNESKSKDIYSLHYNELVLNLMRYLLFSKQTTFNNLLAVTKCIPPISAIFPPQYIQDTPNTNSPELMDIKDLEWNHGTNK